MQVISRAEAMKSSIKERLNQLKSILVSDNQHQLSLSGSLTVMLDQLQAADFQEKTANSRMVVLIVEFTQCQTELKQLTNLLYQQ